jgi:peptidoglycan/LPS O-acetylase OafA/YrhL
MDVLKQQLVQWKVLDPTEAYEVVPMCEQDDEQPWRPTVSAIGQGDSQTTVPQPKSAGLISASMFMTFLRFFRPSFIPSRHGHNYKSPKLLPTTYLNGVRGFAAFCVYLQHYLVKYFKWLDNGYLSTPQDNVFLQMPFIRLIFTGRFMVGNFFILSGFVLAMKPLKLIRKRDYPSLLDCLASSVFRRWPRLFLPLIPPMFFTAFATYFHWYHPQPDPQWIIDPAAQFPTVFERITEEYDWYLSLVNPFTWAVYQPRNTPHMWTLPMEFRGSMVVFLGCLCLSKTKSSVRVFCFAAFAWYCLATAHWDTFLFVCGILLAEFHLIRKDAGIDDFLQLLNVNKSHTITVLSRTFWALVAILALFIGSWPCNHAATTPGLIGALDSLTPSRYGNTEEQHGYFWYSLAACMLMMALENFPMLQRPFASRFAIYLGDISFAFYIIHWTFLWTIGRVITNATIASFGEHLGFALGAVICIPLTICMADVYWRSFDNGSVNFARWVWVKCAVAEPRSLLDDNGHIGNGNPS